MVRVVKPRHKPQFDRWELRARLAERRHTIQSWCAVNGFSPIILQRLAVGHLPGRTGQAAKIRRAVEELLS